MHFGAQCGEIVASVRRMIGAFRRRFTKFAAKELPTVYLSCIRPRLDYGCETWAPIQKQLLDDLDRSQKFAARSVLNDWSISHEEALQRLHWYPIAARQYQLKLLQFYRFYNGWVYYPNAHFAHVDMSERRYSHRLTQPHHLVLVALRANAFTQSFEYSTISTWNALSCDTATSSFDTFKAFLTNLAF